MCQTVCVLFVKENCRNLSIMTKNKLFTVGFMQTHAVIIFTDFTIKYLFW